MAKGSGRGGDPAAAAAAPNGSMADEADSQLACVLRSYMPGGLLPVRVAGAGARPRLASYGSSSMASASTLDSRMMARGSVIRPPRSRVSVPWEREPPPVMSCARTLYFDDRWLLCSSITSRWSYRDGSPQNSSLSSW